MKKLVFAALFIVGFIFNSNAQHGQVSPVIIMMDGGGGGAGSGGGGTGGAGAGGSGYEPKESTECWLCCIDKGTTKNEKSKTSKTTRGGANSRIAGAGAEHTEQVRPERSETIHRTCGVYVKEEN